MIALTLMRLVSFVFVIFMWKTNSFLDVLKIYTPFLFSHYIIAHYSSSKVYFYKGISKRNIVAVILMFILAYILNYYTKVDILEFFLIHFVFSEVYLNEYFKRMIDRSLRAMKTIFYILFYSLVLSHYKNFMLVEAKYYFIAMIFIFALICFYSFRKKYETQWHDLIFLLIGAAAYFTKSEIYPNLIVMYHLTIWCFIPLVKSVKKSTPIMGAHLVFFVLLYYIDLEGYFGYHHYEAHTFLNYFGFLHICLSFANSSFNPQLLRRISGYA